MTDEEPIPSAGARAPGLVARWRLGLAMRIGGMVLGAALVVLLWIRWDYTAFMAWKGEAGPVPFFAVLAVLPAFGVPTTPFYVMAGVLFGVAGGLAGSALSLGVNLLLCYWIAHSGLKGWVEFVLRKTRYDLPTLEGGRALRFALLVKFAPGAPTFLKNYLIALSGVSFAVYFCLSFVVTMAWATGFIVLGESMLDRDFGQAAWALGALGLAGLTGWAVMRWWRGKRLGPRD